jgi:hypothetical protein
MPPVIVLPTSDAIGEGASGRIRGFLEDEDGVKIDASAVTAIAGTLKNHLGVVVNSRSAQDMLNVNQGALAEITVGGVLRTAFTFSATPSDTPVSEAGPEFQLRKLGLIVTHSSGKKAPQEVWFYVRRLSTI